MVVVTTAGGGTGPHRHRTHVWVGEWLFIGGESGSERRAHLTLPYNCVGVCESKRHEMGRRPMNFLAFEVVSEVGRRWRERE